MSFFPKIKYCPCCKTVNLIKINSVSYDNKFQNLENWVLKKKFCCRKCKEEIGLFINNLNSKEKLFWLDYLRCENLYFKELHKLNDEKYKIKTQNKKYYKVLDEIKKIQNIINLEKTKLRIKLKIKSKGSLIRQMY